MAETPQWAQTIIDAHLAVTDQVSHSERIKSDRYFVWQEDGGNDLAANNRHCERTVTGATDLYSKIEFDPWADALCEAFDDAGISWNLVGVEYEEESGFYHWSWDWEVV